MLRACTFKGGIVCLFFFIALLRVSDASATNYTWSPTSGTSWGNPLNWTPNGVPGLLTDRVLFNAGGNCDLDQNRSVGYFEMAGYPGQFNQGTFSLTVNPDSFGNTATDAIIINGGSYTGGSNLLAVQGNFSLQAGTFTCPSLFRFEGDTFSHSSGSTFDHNNGKVIFRTINPLSGGRMNIFGDGTTTFFKVDFLANWPANPDNVFYINNSITVLDTLRKTGNKSNRIFGPGDINVKGNMMLDYYLGLNWGDVKFVFNNAVGNQYLVGYGTTYTDTYIENVIVDKASGGLVLKKYISIAGDLRLINGAIIDSAIFIEFVSNGTIAGRFHLNNAWINSRGTFDQRLIDGVLTVDSLLRFAGHNGADTYGDTIEAKGNIDVYWPTPGGLNFCGGNAHIIINGNRDQHFTSNRTRGMGLLPYIIIDKPPGSTLFLHDTISVERSWTYIRGNVDAVIYNSYIYFGWQSNPYCPSTNTYPDNGTYFIDGEGPSGSYMLFNKMEIEQNRKLEGDVHIKEKLIINDDNLALNGHDLYFENSSNAFIQRTTGYIFSETSSPPGGIRWFIDNAGAGTNYTFPFATAEVPGTSCSIKPIFFDLSVQSAGTPFSGDTGWISVATYPTNPNVPANNRPFPPGITNINNAAGLDNSQGELDRYWVFNCDNYATNPTVSMTFRYSEKDWGTGFNQITEANMRPHQWNGANAWNNHNGTGTINTSTNTSTVSNVTTCSAFTLVDSTVSVNLVFHASDTSICVGETIRFVDDNTAMPSSRTWYFPGGNPSFSTAASPTIRYDTAGCYDAIMWATYNSIQYKDTFECYIHVSDSFSISLTSANVLCNGNDNGTISVSVSRMGTYSYSWSDGGPATQNRTGLGPGTYVVTVADAAAIGCDRTDSVTITEPAAPLSVVISNVQDAACSCDGEATVTPSGGTPPFIYQWDSSGTAPNSTTLCPGLRTVTVTDAGGCTVSDTVTININAVPLIITIDTVIPVTCNGRCDGQATVSATGGVGGFSYSWSCWGQTTQTAVNLCAGVCDVMVTDTGGCTATAFTNIPQPDSLKITVTAYDISSFGANDGRVRAIVTGGTLPYSLTHSPPTGRIDTVILPQDSIDQLPPVEMCFSVFDIRGCLAQSCDSVTEPLPPFVIDSIGWTDVTCPGVNDGTAWVIVAGGTNSFSYSWSDVNGTTDSLVTGLPPGLVTVTITDNGTGSTITGSVTIGQPAGTPITFTPNIQPVYCNGGCDGMAWVLISSISGGAPPYSFSWSTGSTNDTIMNLCAGDYHVTVTDSVGCSAPNINPITVSEPLPISISQTITPVTCPGGSNGAISISTSGGNPGPYTQLWSNGQTTAAINGLSEGYYSVIVSDVLSCTATESYTVGVGNRFEVSANMVNASCGSNDGAINLTVLSGTATSYSWSNGRTTEDIDTLAAGQYTVIVTAGICTQTLTATVEDAGGPTVSGSVTDAANCNTSDGSINLTVTNGLGAYTFSWSHGPATQNVSSLNRGSYTVTVTDDTTSCASISTFDVGVVNGISLSGTVTDAACNQKDGAIDLTVLSGSGGYVYNWSNGALTADLTDLGFGTYGVTVTDNTGCTGNGWFAVSENGPAVSGAVANVTCYGKNDGAITLTVSGINTYVWSTGAVSSSLSNLLPGTYSVTVNDTSLCSGTEVFEVTEPDALALSADRSGISCGGANNGWIDLTVTGGTTNYTYSWTGPNSYSTQDISNLSPGSYSITTTDANSCTSGLSSIEITEPDPMVLTIDTVRVSCGGAADGQASVTVAGGVPDYDYLWNSGTPIDSSTVMNLDTGSISVTVTDANGCTATGSSVINQQPPLTVSISKTDISCFGLINGQAAAIAGGGTPGYRYSWSKGTPQLPDSSTVMNLDSGYVAVTVTDSKNCIASDSIRIVEPVLLTNTIISDSVNCFGESNGSAIVTPAGGTSPYSYAWNPATSTDSIITGLATGVVYVTVTDFRSCTSLDTTTILQPDSLTLAITSTNNICANGTNGTAAVSVSGGTPGYAYSWSPVGQPGASDSIRIQLPVGPVSVTITDWHNCSKTASVTITSPPPITLTLNQINISCFGADDGRAYATPGGGSPGYTYLWNSGTPPLNLDSVTGLGPDTVTIRVTDSLGCTKDSFVNIIEPAEITLAMDSLNISCYGLTDGEASVTAGGGTPAFTYSWNTGDITASITSQAAGIKIVTVTDSRLCTNTDSVNVIQPPQIIIDSIIQSNVSCFNGSNGTAQVFVQGGTPSQPGAAGYTYNWMPGTPVPPNDRVAGLSAGTVNVTVTDSRGCEADSNTVITQPLDFISAIISGTDVSCFGGTDGTAKVRATGGTPSQPGAAGYTYLWNPPGTSVPPGDSVHGLSAGLVSVTVTDDNGCTKSASIPLNQPAVLILTLVVDSNTNCHGGTTGGLTVNLVGGTANYSYSWSTTEQLPNTPLTSHGIDGLGVGSYTVFVTDANGCQKQADTTIIERAGPQIAANGIVLDQPTCDRDDGSITLNITTQDPGLTYSWSPTNTGSGDNPRITLPEGVYNVTITDASACDTSLTINLVEIPGPQVQFEKIKDSYCDDNDGRATAIITGGTPGYSFTWVDESSTTISTDSIITGLAEGLYSLIVADANACDTQINFSISNIASPNAQISPLSPQTIYVGQVIELSATSDIPTSVFTWSPSKGLTCSDCTQPSANPSSTTTYVLRVFDANTQCSDTAYMTIIVKDEDNIFVPNVITPNGDGINDYWNIADLLEVFPDNEVVVINRWGDEVFRQKNYGSTQSSKWDGFYKGEKLPDGTYYYLIKLNNIDKTVTGPVTIISE